MNAITNIEKVYRNEEVRTVAIHRANRKMNEREDAIQIIQNGFIFSITAYIVALTAITLLIPLLKLLS